MNPDLDSETEDSAVPLVINEPHWWYSQGWTARIIKNEDDEGWAVAMIKDGETEPALVGPWTMGRDKKNPKPLDAPAFLTLVKTATEVLRRHEHQRHALLHKKLTLNGAEGRVTITLDIVPDEYEPHAVLGACDAFGEPLAAVRVSAGFKLNNAIAQRWMENGFASPELSE
ncbi:MAG: hypothetical protein D3M94_09390 [Rhodocyclales bacterium GT-UBC]|nr:MAG: hypothetical protein D3M94_09390 [Rhodocyclales bacterium GT-UBC]